jgi:GntR family transcriptional regulator
MTIAGRGPLYIQVRDLLIKRIHGGEWNPGEPIPGETRLARELSVSQGTVRKAIGELVSGNVLVRQQGKGTFVAAHDSQRALFHFFHVVADRGDKVLPRSHTVSNRRRVASREEINALALSGGDEVIRIERIRMLGETLVFAETVAVPARLFAGLEKLVPREVPNTLYELYERVYRITIHRADEHLKAVKASSRVARTLHIDAGDPLLRIERIAYTLNGTPVEFRISFCNTRHHHYANSIT